MKVKEIPAMVDYFGYDTIISVALNDGQYILASYLINRKLDEIEKLIGKEYT
jgi:hypothetical protein